jgi:hypothetical protein
MGIEALFNKSSEIVWWHQNIIVPVAEQWGADILLRFIDLGKSIAELGDSVFYLAVLTLGVVPQSNESDAHCCLVATPNV